MIVALLCAALVAQVQDPPRFTIEQRALRADVALRKIGEEFGIKLVPDKSTKNDVLLVYLPDVTFEQFRQKTAEGWNAGWKETSTGWQFHRTTEQEQIEIDWEAHERRKAFQNEIDDSKPEAKLTEKDIKELVEDLHKPVDEFLDQESEREGKVRDFGERAMSLLLSKLNADLLVNLATYESAFFTTSRDSTFTSLPALDFTFETYSKETGRLLRELKKAGIYQYVTETVMPGSEERLLAFTLGVTSSPLVMTVKFFANEGMVRVTLRLFDNAGLEVFEEALNLSAWPRRKSPLPDSLTSAEFELSERGDLISRAYVNLYNLNFSSRNEPISPALVELWSRMPEDDLLSYSVSECLFEMGRLLGKGVVARLNDGLLASPRGIPRYAESGKIRLDRFLRSLSSYHTFVVSQDESVVNVSPRYDYLESDFRYPRDRIAQYVRENAGSRSIDLDAAARMISGSPGNGTYNGVWRVFEVHPTRQILGFGRLDTDLLMAYRSVPADARSVASLTEGLVMRFDQTDPTFQALVRIQMSASGYWNNESFYFRDLDNETSYLFGTGDRNRFADLIDVSLPKGLPPDTRVTINVRPVDHVFSDSSLDYGMIWSIESNAAIQARFEMGVKGFLEDERPLEEEYRIGTAVEVSYVMQIAGSRIGKTDVIKTGLGDGKKYKFDELPLQVRSRFWKLVEEHKARLGGATRS